MSAETLAKAVELHQAGKLDKALRLYKKVLGKDPRNYAALHMSGVIEMQSGRLAAAERLIRCALPLAPDARERERVYINLAAVAMAAGRSADAAEAYRQILELDPDSRIARAGLVNALREGGEVEAAIATARALLDAAPDDAPVLRELGASLNAGRRPLDAAVALRRCLELAPEDIAARNNLANLLEVTGHLDEAVAQYRQALAIEPDNAQIHCNLGNALKFGGRFDEAKAAYADCLAIDPDQAEARYAMSELVKGEEAATAQREAKAALARTREPQARAWLNFALARLAERTGDTDTAFHHLQAGNRIQRESIRYDVAADEARMRELADAFPGPFPEPEGGEGPVIVVGMPRSGTTLVEQMLGAHPALVAGGELGARRCLVEFGAGADREPQALATLAAAQADAIGKSYYELAYTVVAEGARFVDKMPENFLFLGVIAQALPEARIVHVRRDPLDICLSCFQQRFVSEQYFSYDLRELARYYAAYARLMAHWERVLGTRIHTLEYEALVESPEAVAKDMLAFCGLDWDPAVLEFHRASGSVRTASAAQVRNPVYASARGRWRRYERQLTPLLKAFEAAGYSLR